MTRALAPFAALALAAIPVVAMADSLTIRFASTPYTLAATCDLSQPLVLLNVILQNQGAAATGPQTLVASDPSGVLRGTLALVSVAPAGTVAFSIPLRSPGMNPAAIAGTHPILVSAGPLHSQPLPVQIPPAFCAATAAPAAPSVTPTASASANGSAPSAVKRPNVKIVIATPTPKPVVFAKTPARRIAIAANLLGVPVNVRPVAGGPDCGAHVGPIGALVCPDMIKSGDLLLVWDWQPGAGPSDIDGYRVYRIDKGLRQLVSTRTNKKDLTLVDLAKPSGGYAGKCYAVSAFVSDHESVLSAPFCAGGGSTATSVTLYPNHARSTVQQRDNTMFTVPPNPGLIVGFQYSKQIHTFGDDYHNYIYRSALGFDESALANRRLVSAKLRLSVAWSRGAGNNHSCITDVGTGTEFWWQSTGWIEGAFGYGIAPTDTGPQIAADVTPIVASWLRNEPNYGFVLKNADENLGAFIDKECQTAYANPVLEVTYY